MPVKNSNLSQVFSYCNTAIDFDSKLGIDVFL